MQKNTSTTTTFEEQIQDRLLTTIDLSKRWGIKPNTLEIARVRGTGPKFIRLGPGKRAFIRYRLKDVQQYETDNTKTCTAQE